MQTATLKPAKVDRMMAITACIRTCLEYWFTQQSRMIKLCVDSRQ